MEKTNNGGKIMYRFKTGARIKADPQVAGEMCERLDTTGGLTPARLLDANRDATAPLHGCFEWDDPKAAEEYRKGQAAHVIRSLVVVSVSLPKDGTEDDPLRTLVCYVGEKPEGEVRLANPVRAFVTLDSGKSGTYEPLQECLFDEGKAERLLAQAKEELAAFVRKYHMLKSLVNPIEQMLTQTSLWEPEPFNPPARKALEGFPAVQPRLLDGCGRAETTEAE